MENDTQILFLMGTDPTMSMKKLDEFEEEMKFFKDILLMDFIGNGIRKNPSVSNLFDFRRLLECNTRYRICPEVC